MFCVAMQYYWRQEAVLWYIFTLELYVEQPISYMSRINGFSVRFWYEHYWPASMLKFSRGYMGIYNGSLPVCKCLMPLSWTCAYTILVAWILFYAGCMWWGGWVYFDITVPLNLNTYTICAKICNVQEHSKSNIIVSRPNRNQWVMIHSTNLMIVIGEPTNTFMIFFELVLYNRLRSRFLSGANVNACPT